MSKLMAAIDLPREKEPHLTEFIHDLKNGGCDAYKLHEPFHGMKPSESIQLLRKAVLPGKAATVMLDSKRSDIKGTVIRGVENAVYAGADLVTVHASSGRSVFQELQRQHFTEKNVVAVMVLSHLAEKEVKEIFGSGRTDTLRRLAPLAAEYGVTRFVTDVPNLPVVKKAVAPWCKNPIFFAVSVRPSWFKLKTEQKMESRPTQARLAGAEFVIMGRPLELSKDPRAEVQRINRILSLKKRL